MLKKIFWVLSLGLMFIACEKHQDIDPNNSVNNGTGMDSTEVDSTSNDTTHLEPTDKRDAYMGEYSVRDSLYSPLGGLEEVKFYTLYIEKHESPDSIFISNLADTSWSMTAAFYDSTFYVWGQYIDDSSSVHASGGGAFQGDSLFMEIASWRYSHSIDGKKQ